MSWWWALPLGLAAVLILLVPAGERLEQRAARRDAELWERLHQRDVRPRRVDP